MAARQMGTTMAGKTSFKPSAAAEIPEHVRRAGLTLTFHGFFREAVSESRLERDRVRTLRITYFMEDETVAMYETKHADSGIPEGTFLRRGKIPLGRTAHGITALGRGGGIDAVDGSFLSWKDLRVGETISVLGRRIRLTRCDDATRSFYTSLGDVSMEQAPNQAEPEDEYTRTRKATSLRETGAGTGAWHGVRSSPIQRYAEATLGNPSGKQIRAAPDTLGRFLRYGGQRLSFKGLMEDPKVFGTPSKVIINVFPEDDTVDIIEVYGNNKGYSTTSARLFKRGQLPRSGLMHDDRSRSIEDDNGESDYYTASEFRVGCEINVLGRKVRLYDATPATLQWLAANGEAVAKEVSATTSRAGVKVAGLGASLRGGVTAGAHTVRFSATTGVDGMPNDDDEADAADAAAGVADVDGKPVAGPIVEPSAYMGIGSEEDSLGSFYSLTPKYPRRDPSRGIKFEGMALKFKAKLSGTRAVASDDLPTAAAAAASAAGEDVDPLAAAMSSDDAAVRSVSSGIGRIDATREFVVTWFMEDETLTVYEPPCRNSGVIGGKFLSRRRLRNPATGDFFRDADFFIGAVLKLGGHIFHMYDAENFTKRLLKGEAKVWGSSDVRFVLNILRTKFADFSTTMRRAFRSMDKDYSGTITVDELETQLRKWGMKVTSAELAQIFNHYDRGDSGKWSFDDFCNAFTDPDYGDDAGGVGVSDADKAQMLTADELSAYQEHVTSVRLNDQEQEHLTRLLETFASEFAARSGEERMAQEFRRVDLDKSNTVDKDEFRFALTESFHLRDEDADLLEKQFFPPGKEELDYEAFMQHLRGMLKRSTH
jgi:Ca2+-binding EF-hand superfamily protein